MHIKFDKNLFNKLYFDIIDSYKESRYLLIYGGAGSGKSFSLTQFLILRLMIEKNFKLLVCRKYGSTLGNSVIDLFLQVLKQYNKSLPFELVKNWNKVERKIELWNGNQVIFTGLDDVEKLKSVNNISSIYIEEASEIVKEDLYQLDARLRGSHLVNPNIYLLFNPTSKQHWIYNYWFEEERENTIILKSTCEDNRFIDEGYKETLRGYASIDMSFYRRYYLGEFCDVQNEMGVYRHFNESHIHKLTIDKTKPLYLSFDFNVNPCVSVTCYQINGDELWCVDEFYKFGDNIEMVCKRILEKYNDMTFIVTGDPSGKAQNVANKSGVNYFTIIQNYLGSNVLRVQVQSVADNVLTRTNWINQIFLGANKIKFKIDLNCKNTISDIYESKYTKDGSGKDKATGKINGVVCQLHNHLNDTMDYMFGCAFRDDYIKFKSGGDRKLITINKTSTW